MPQAPKSRTAHNPSRFSCSGSRFPVPKATPVKPLSQGTLKVSDFGLARRCLPMDIRAWALKAFAGSQELGGLQKLWDSRAASEKWDLDPKRRAP